MGLFKRPTHLKRTGNSKHTLPHTQTASSSTCPKPCHVSQALSANKNQLGYMLKQLPSHSISSLYIHKMKRSGHMLSLATNELHIHKVPFIAALTAHFRAKQCVPSLAGGVASISLVKRPTQTNKTRNSKHTLLQNRTASTSICPKTFQK